MSNESLSVTIRPAREADAAELHRLATLDSATVPGGPILVAEIDGQLVAAIEIASHAVIADPFKPTSAAVELLTTRARRLDPPRGRRPLSSRRRGRRVTATRAA